eukprot:4763973-Pyramimonas_sp.AAC.1
MKSSNAMRVSLVAPVNKHVQACSHLGQVQERRRQRKEWGEWCTQAGSGHAQKAFSFLRVSEYRPEDVVGAGPCMSPSLPRGMEAEVEHWSKAWDATPNKAPLPSRASMCPIPVPPPAHPEVIRAIARRFTMRTCTPDGRHPRHYSLLSAGALEALSLIFHIMGVLGTAPTSIQM